jgi:hypothetical protein
VTKLQLLHKISKIDMISFAAKSGLTGLVYSSHGRIFNNMVFM